MGCVRYCPPHNGEDLTVSLLTFPCSSLHQVEELLDPRGSVFSHDLRLLPHHLPGTCSSRISGKWQCVSSAAFVCVCVLPLGGPRRAGREFLTSPDSLGWVVVVVVAYLINVIFHSPPLPVLPRRS